MRKNFMKKALFLLLLALAPAVPVQARTEAIAAVVNQDAISMNDLGDRLHLTMASAGLPNSPEIRKKLIPQVLDSLVEEQLKMQEARRLDIKITKEDIEAGFAELAKQNKFTPEQFRDMISRGGLSLATMERQIESQLAWAKVIQQVMRPQIEVTDSDIDDYIARIKSSKGKTEYLVSDILIKVSSDKKEAEARDVAMKLSQEITSGHAPFGKVAQQFSASPGAVRGGDLGWVLQGQLQTELEKTLAAMQKGAVSAPVRAVDGYHILQLRDMREVSDTNLPPRDNILNAIGLQRLERAQARYLLDLKTTAFIENRVQAG